MTIDQHATEDAGEKRGKGKCHPGQASLPGTAGRLQDEPGKRDQRHHIAENRQPVGREKDKYRKFD